jgi:hypothetical protein
MRIAVIQYDVGLGHYIGLVMAFYDRCRFAEAARGASDGIGLLTGDLIALVAELVDVAMQMTMGVVEVAVVIVGCGIGCVLLDISVGFDHSDCLCGFGERCCGREQ